MKIIKFLVLVLMLIPILAYSQPVIQLGGKDDTGAAKTTPVGASGEIPVLEKDKDRDLHALTNSGINGQLIGAGVSLKSATPVLLPNYSEIMAHVSWTFAAAVDSDSVNIEVYFIGKLSTNIADGIDLVFDSFSTSGASFTASGAGVDGWYITRNTNLYSPAPPMMILAKRVTGSGVQHQSALLTTWSTTFPIANNYGHWMKSPYIMVIVQNRSPTKAINVIVDFFPKVR